MTEVLLVGNSITLLDGSAGQVIDDYDKVVRFNGGNPTKHQDAIGSRTDYWSFSTVNESEYLKWKIPGAIPMCLNMRIDYPFMSEDAIYNNAGTYRQLRMAYGHPRPSTGLITAHYIAKLWKCRVSCIGFDFFESDTWYRGSNEHIPHDGGLEREYMQSLGVTIL